MGDRSDGSRLPAPSPVIVPGRPEVRTVFQLKASIPLGGRSEEELFSRAVGVILKWVGRKVPKTPEMEFPPGAWKGESFRAEVPGQWVEAAASEGKPARWALRLEQPDSPGPYGNHAAVAGRTWTTDLALGREENGLSFACRVVCASLPYARAPVSLSRPRVVKDLAREVGLFDGRPLDGKPWLVEGEEDLEALFELLLHPGRFLPVTLLSEPDPQEARVPVRRFVLDPGKLAEDLSGLSHLVLMPRELGFRWTRRMGRRWTAFNGAVVTYRPGINLQEDPPHLHPKVLLEHILFWRHDGLEGERAFEAFLKERALRFLAERAVRWDGVAFLPEVRSLCAEEARRRSGETAEWGELYAQENEALRQQLDQAKKEAEQFCDLALAAERQRDAVLEENKRLRAALDALRAGLAVRSGGDPDAGLEFPESYEDLPTWVSRNLAGRLVLHPRAERALKDARFEDLSLVARALLLLAKEYRDFHCGQGPWEAFEGRAKELHLRFGRSIEEGRAGQEGEEYFVRYPFGGPHRRLLEFHLRKGSDKDPRHHLAVYFFWDPETRQVVVGWLPSHLDNRMT